ncbi:MAG: proline racemase family protein, partial [Candidatus Limnocylindrales bacterium]
MQQPQPQQPVMRHYRGRNRRVAEEAYRLDAAHAALMSWMPVAHRWTDDWDGHTLSVVFELRASTMAPDRSFAPAPSPGTPSGFQDIPAPQGAVPLLPAQEQAPQAPVHHAPQPTHQSAGRAHARTSITTIDLHSGGEPLRLIRSGYPHVPMAPILERRRWVKEHADAIRTTTMFEPRGHRDMYGAVLLEPSTPDADVAVLFMHNEGYSTMCGHGIIAVTTALLEERLYPVSLPETVIRFETPAGIVTARASCRPAAWGGPDVDRVRFTNVPSYLA